MYSIRPLIVDLGNKYIHFEKSYDTGKTQQWRVINKSSGFNLGLIAWNGGWRQYTFLPSENTEFTNGCLETIIKFLNRLNKEKRING
jgi:hypothetical protein